MSGERQDQQLYKQSLGGEVGVPEQLTRVDGHRFADAAVDEARGRLLAVREDHTGAGEAVNTVAAVCAPGVTFRVQVYLVLTPNPQWQPAALQFADVH